MPVSIARRSRLSSPADSLTTYLNTIGTYRLLTREEECALARRIREGDPDALEKLVCANLRFVVSVAKKYQRHSVPLADLVNEGNLGLMHAAEKFDETKGVKFISYAVWWIRQAIIQALAEQGHAVRIPLSRAGTLFRLRRRAEDLRRELGREPTQLELADGADLSEAELAETMSLTRSSLSLDAPVSANDTNLLDYLPDEDAASTDANAIDVARTKSVMEAVSHLRAREATVIRCYFGFDREEPMTLEAIGGMMGITRERARQLKERALSRLRKSARSAALATFHDL